MDDFLKPDGRLQPILERVKRDQTLLLAIREGYVNIYYRGGNLLKVTEQGDGAYQTHFDTNYDESKQKIPISQGTITTQGDAEREVKSFGEKKNIMDEYFSIHGKAEREFQQLVARENNYSSISNETEYFIPDIEAAEPIGRFDMMAVRWLARDRKTGNKCTAAMIEMKYSDAAIGGKAGLLKHLKDMDTFIVDTKRYEKRLRTMESQFNQLDQLGLLKFNKGTSNAKVKLKPEDKPEVIFILANHNPRSTGLSKILNAPEIVKYEQPKRFDLRFFVATFAGYGLHAKCMRTLAELRGLCKALDDAQYNWK